MCYLSGAAYEPVLQWEFGGYMAQPGHQNALSVVEGIAWAADYGESARFDDGAWLSWLEQRAGRGHCLFALLPDVPMDMAATLRRSLTYVDPLRALGYPVGLAVHNGVRMRQIPWDEIDAIVVAGDRAFKTTVRASDICREAKQRGKFVHIKQRNSKKDLESAYGMFADSIDGNLLAFTPDRSWLNLQRWFAEFCSHPDTRLRLLGSDPRLFRCEKCGKDVWKLAECTETLRIHEDAKQYL